MEGARIGFWDWDLAGGTVQYSIIWAEILGYSLDDVNNDISFWQSRIHPGDAEDVLKDMQGLCDGSIDTFDREHRLKNRHGKWIWVLGRGAVREYDEQDAPKRVSGIVFDITQRKQAETYTEQSKHLLQTVLESIGAAVFHVDPQHYKIIYANQNGLDLLGMSLEELQSTPCFELICPNKSVAEGSCCKLYKQKVLNNESVLVLPDGRRIPIIKHVVPAEIHGRNIQVEIIFDMTELKEMERQLSHSQKIESIGMLAAGIAHEINTPIQFIGDNLYFLQESFSKVFECLDLATEPKTREKDESCTMDELQHPEAVNSCTCEEDVAFYREEVPNAVEEALHGVERVSKIVQAMKKFSHMGNEDFEFVDINSALDNTVVVSKNEWKYHSEIETDLKPNLPLVRCLPADLNQVFLNILVNASHAVAERYTEHEGAKMGRIRIETKAVDDHIEIRISDNGSGIPESHRQKIFDPFFTTKEVGKGTGQGLAISYDIIVKKHGGVLDFETVAGEGTTFIIRLPVDAGIATGDGK